MHRCSEGERPAGILYGTWETTISEVRDLSIPTRWSTSLRVSPTAERLRQHASMTSAAGNSPRLTKATVFTSLSAAQKHMLYEMTEEIAKGNAPL